MVESGIKGPLAIRRAVRQGVRLAWGAAAALALAGCGNTYRPVVTAINPVGPAAQPQKYALAVASSPNPNTPGLVTLVDFSGDTVLVTPNVGVGPYFLAIDPAGVTGYTLNSDTTLTSFDISPSLLTNQVLETTLLAGANPNGIFPYSQNTYVTEPGRNAVAQLSGSPIALHQELPVTANPVWVAGISGGARAYVISQGSTPGVPGVAAAIESANNTISTTIPVGVDPVYALMTADGKRVYVVNSGDNTVSVLNAQTNQLDVVPTGATNPIAVGATPVWADLAPARNELVVANAGNGKGVGSVSIVNIPLCSTTAQPTNPNCNSLNPTDAAGFGQVLATVPVGHSPVMVAVLQDGTRAYVANYQDSTVSVVSLLSNTVTATIPVVGRPIYIAATQGTPTGKVYVVSADTVAPNKNSVMTVIRTDTDTVDTTIDLQGTGVSVKVTQK
ncbi:MAG: YncE family protein [Acidobacteriota bacterium]|nr:YncE family protein [Acidobacteriota bacterium]